MTPLRNFSSPFIVPEGNRFFTAFTFPRETLPSFPGVTLLPSPLSHSLSLWQVHLSTHIGNCSPAQRDQQLSLKGSVPLLSGDQVNLQGFFCQDIPAQLVRVGLLSFWN